jgi:hypothetical protein
MSIRLISEKGTIHNARFFAHSMLFCFLCSTYLFAAVIQEPRKKNIHGTKERIYIFFFKERIFPAERTMTKKMHYFF